MSWNLQGILGTVTYNNAVLDKEWKITGYPLENVIVTDSLNAGPGDIKVPALYEGQFALPDATPLDTFLDTTGWDKVNYTTDMWICRWFSSYNKELDDN